MMWPVGRSLAVQIVLTPFCSEVWMADLAYYQSVREAAHRNRAGAQDVYDDLRQRFPGVRASKATPEPATA